MAGEIKEARVNSVTNGVAEVFCEYTGQTIPDVRVSVSGMGVEKGDLVLVGHTDDGDGEWHVLSKAREVPHSGTNPDPETDQIGEDHGFALPNGARMTLRRDGRVEIVSNGGTALYMLPLDSLVHMNLKKLRVVGTHGTVLFEPCVFGVQLSRKLGDAASISLVLGNAGKNFGVGAWSAGKDVDFRMATGDSFILEVASDGSVSVKAKDVGLQALGTTRLDLQGPLDAKTKNVTIDGGISPYSVKCGVLDVSVQVSLKFSAPVIALDGDLVMLGKNANGPAIDGLQFFLWLMTQVVPKGGRVTPDAAIAFLTSTLNWQVLL